MLISFVVVLLAFIFDDWWLQRIVKATQVPDSEYNALLDLYNSTSGEFWKWRSGPVWNFTRDVDGQFIDNPCSSIVTSGTSAWQGITCSMSPQHCLNVTCNIIGITLDNYGLAGTLPNSLNDLAQLVTINFYSNLLSGFIPNQIGNLTALTYLDFWSNILSGPIPIEIGSCLALERLYLDTNLLTGSIPFEITLLIRLNRIYFGANMFTGSIPSAIGKLTLLERLYLDSNTLTSSIPPELWELTSLQRLYFFNNSLTGCISSAIGDLKMLQIFECDDNLFTGVIPIEISNLLDMWWFDVQINLFTGYIPSEIGDMTLLQVLDCSSNFLSGTVTTEVSNLINLRFLDLYNNALTGSIPSEIGYMINLELLHFGKNLFVGSIPKEISRLIYLNTLRLPYNALSGSIPSEISNLVALTILDLRNNVLTGSIPIAINNLANLSSLFLYSNKLIGSVDNVFNSSRQVMLEVIDMSDNLLSGQGLDTLFLLSGLRVLTLSVNCFNNELPASICTAKNIEVLSLNGLGAAEGCENTFRFPLSGVSLFNAIGGTVPDCVWNLRNLSVLHLTGNGLTGEIISYLPSYSQINDLSLSHNQLKGTIPPDVFNVKTLDISYNQLSGTFADGAYYAKKSSVTLEVNHLSGRLPVSVLENENVSSLNILRGNLFACATIPQNDEFAEDYTCGSEKLNNAIYVFFSLLIASIIALMTWLLLMSSWSSFFGSNLVHCVQTEANRLWMYRSYFVMLRNRTEHPNDIMQKIVAISNNFHKASKFFLVLLFTVLVTSVPIYSLRLSDASDTYSTHFYTYTWFWTLAYMRGVLPASLIIISWMVVLSISFFLLIVSPARDTAPEILPPSESQKHNQEEEQREERNINCQRSPALTTVLAVVFNSVVAISVNVIYIYSTQQNLSSLSQQGIQLGMALFRLVYSFVCVPILSRHVKDTIANINFRTRLLIVNNLIFPCIATAFTSPSCFQGLLVSADAVSTPYVYTYCSATGVNDGVCDAYSVIEVDSVPLIPPFTYNNQCASVLLTSYIPVFILGYAIQFFLTLALPASLIYLGRVLDIEAILSIGLFEGILYPTFWSRKNNPDVLERNKFLLERKPETMLDIKSFFCFEVLNNLIVLLTFGLCSPILALVIVLVVVLKMNVRLLLVGRFASIMTGDDKEDVQYALEALGASYTPISEVCQRSFWIIAWNSALFILLISWDIAIDDVGWLKSIWVPAITLCYCVFLWIVAFCLFPTLEDNNIASSEKELRESLLL